MEGKTKLKLAIIAGAIAILMLPALLFGAIVYFTIISILGVLIGGLYGFVWCYNKLFKELL